ncbi:hypothetical protein BH10ACT1_BH10ACT1_40350 [soil metagenome]
MAANQPDPWADPEPSGPTSPTPPRSGSSRPWMAVAAGMVAIVAGIGGGRALAQTDANGAGMGPGGRGGAGMGGFPGGGPGGTPGGQPPGGGLFPGQGTNGGAAATPATAAPSTSTTAAGR